MRTTFEVEVFDRKGNIIKSSVAYDPKTANVRADMHMKCYGKNGAVAIKKISNHDKRKRKIQVNRTASAGK